MTSPAGPGAIRALALSLRPHQWVKNLFVFAGVVFARKLFTPLFWPALAAFALFCVFSGAVYLVNDVVDYDRDRLHPQKRHRPVASGALGRGTGLAFAVGLGLAGLALSVWLSPPFAVVAVCYVVLMLLYSARLKHLVVLDVLAVAIGFVLRAIAGTVVIDVEISGWLLICTVLVALFLALGKRRHELLTLEGDAPGHRPILLQYSPGLLDQMIAVVTASTVTAYALYTMSPETVEKFHTRFLPLTLPFVLYGIFRYLYLLYRRELGGNPSELFLNDRPLLLNSALWALTVLLIIYGPALIR